MIRLQSVRMRLLAQPPPVRVALLWAAAAVAAPTLIRQALDPLVREVTFSAYYPFVVFAALFLGWRYALGVTFAATLLANFLFMAPRYRLMAGPSDTVGAVLFFISSSLMIVTAETLRHSVREVDDGVRREAALNRELQHRVRNMITVVQGLAAQTFRRGGDAGEALPLFIGRLHALAEANAVLSGGRWETCGLPDLAERALAPFRADGRIALSGPPCTLGEVSCVPLVLALHELGVNAVKYGALSAAGGRVEVSWSLQEEGGARRLVMVWRERGGPPVRKPTRRGLGSRLLCAQRGLEAVDLDFAPEGLTCLIRAPDAAGVSEPRAAA